MILAKELMALSQPKNERLYVRVSSMEKAMFEEAARAENTTTSAFIVREALASAEEVLADRTRFELPADKWEEFVAILDEPARDLPGLRRLLGESAPDDGA
ncbi:DUF1778 domain-containing protein [bacterium]|nr:DUF1778 domain-containing protein [bacterium]